MIKRSLAKRLRAEFGDLAPLMDDLDALTAVTNPCPRVVACGLVNAGKSSLLNALTEHLEIEHFPSKAVRETVSLKELVHGNVAFVDTPGIDAPAADEQEAWYGVAGADVYLFVHTLRQPEFDAASEVPFLREIAARQPDAARRIFVVLSNVESAAAHLDMVRAKLAAELAQLFGAVPPMLSYSFATYARGRAQQKTELVRQSGFPEVSECLRRMTEDPKICGTAARDARLVELQRRLAARLEEIVEGKVAELASTQQRDAEVRTAFATAVDAFFAKLSEKFSRYQELV